MSEEERDARRRLIRLLLARGDIGAGLLRESASAARARAARGTLEDPHAVDVTPAEGEPRRAPPPG